MRKLNHVKAEAAGNGEKTATTAQGEERWTA